MNDSPAPRSPAGWLRKSSLGRPRRSRREAAGGHERLDDRQHRLGLGLCSPERADHERAPVLLGQHFDGDLGLPTALLGEPGFAQPVAPVLAPSALDGLREALSTTRPNTDLGYSATRRAHLYLLSDLG